MLTSPTQQAQERAVVFVDGNNCYHALKKLRVGRLDQLNYAKVSEKLVGPRDWIQTRFYIGQVKNEGNTALYNGQRAYFAFLARCDRRISIHLGRLESHLEVNELAHRLKSYLATLKTRIDDEVFKDLIALGNAFERHKVTEEKAVDVALAVDLVMMAHRDEYDTAYLMSADGDMTPAVKAAADLGKKIFVASPASGAQVAAVAYKFIPLKPQWFDDCFGL